MALCDVYRIEMGTGWIATDPDGSGTVDKIPFRYGVHPFQNESREDLPELNSGRLIRQFLADQIQGSFHG